MSSLKNAMEGDDVDKIKAESEMLSAAAMKLGERIHPPETEPADRGESGGDEEIIDADFEETDERKWAKGE